MTKNQRIKELAENLICKGYNVPCTKEMQQLASIHAVLYSIGIKAPSVGATPQMFKGLLK